MKIAASTIQSGDIVRGIGVKVLSVAQIDNGNWAAINGTVSTRNPLFGAMGEETEEYTLTPVTMSFPSDHRINVRRSDENFRADRLSLVQEALDRAYGEVETDHIEATALLADRLYRVGCMPRGRKFQLQPESVRDFVAGLLDGTETAEGVLDSIDALDVPEEEPFDGEVVGGFGLVVFPAPQHN